MVEAVLVVVISALLFQRSYKPISRKGDDLTDKVHCTSHQAQMVSVSSVLPSSVMP